jgi:topoisomerase-4 subunit A
MCSERAVPAIDDGLKPVQRRFLHRSKEMDDGVSTVANVIGSMQYHPHGDASIGDAIATIGQKELLLDIQGNWGGYPETPPPPSRYIEVRLKICERRTFSTRILTEWQLSDDGRWNPLRCSLNFRWY